MDNKSPNILNADAILKQFGGVNKNMLENLTNVYEHEENEINTICHSPYYSIENLPSVLSSKNGNFNISI